MTLDQVRSKFPQYAKYNDEALAAAVWNQYYKNKLSFQDFSQRIGYTTGMIPRESDPAMPEDPSKSDPASDVGNLFDRIMQNVQAVPMIAGAAGGITGLARMGRQAPAIVSKIPGATKVTEALGAFAQPLEKYAAPLVPKTGTELVRQTAAAGAAAPFGYGAAQLAEPTAKAIGEVVPLPQVRGEKGQAKLAEALNIPFTAAGELLGTSALGRGRAFIQRSLAQRPAGIPEERLAAARGLEARGAKMPPKELMRGADISKFMEVYNKRYNRLVGNTEKTSFGTKEFVEARNRLNQDYKTLLGGKSVSFDDQFFNDIKSLLDYQRSMASTGVMFAESRPIINTLSQLKQLPADLQARINALKDVPEATQDIGVSQNALKIIDDALGFLAVNKITMDAEVYNNIRSQLGNAAYRTADPERGKVLRGMQKAFDSAADRSLPADISQNLKTVRDRWETLKILEEAQKRSEPGMILPQSVGQVTRARYDAGAMYGNKEIYDIGQEGMSLGVKPATPGVEIDPVQLAPTQVGGARQKLSIAEKAARKFDPRPKQILAGPETAEDLFRKQQLQNVRIGAETVQDTINPQAGEPVPQIPAP